MYSERVDFKKKGRDAMASNTTQTRTIRANKNKKQGRKRKNKLVNHGTTLTSEELFKVQDAE
jgi:hypothetical protein